MLDRELFYDDLPSERSGQERSVISLRTKVEKQKMIKRAHAAKTRSNTMSWARCLLQHVYSVWYLYLPSLITILEGGEEQRAQLQTALQIIQTLRTERNTNLEEVVLQYIDILLFCVYFSESCQRFLKQIYIARNLNCRNSKLLSQNFTQIQLLTPLSTYRCVTGFSSPSLVSTTTPRLPWQHSLTCRT